jgi:hypothetical protein
MSVYLSDVFSGVAMKYLSDVEANPKTSNQHELNGVQALKRVFGGGARERFRTRFLWFGPDGESLASDGHITWYDSRSDHPTRSEYRLYFSDSDISRRMRSGDAIFAARKTDGNALVVVTPTNGTAYRQLVWLFGIDADGGGKLQVVDLSRVPRSEVGFAARLIIEELGLEVDDDGDDYFEELEARFGNTFPPTAAFSEFARSTVRDVSVLDDPDRALVKWLEREEILFRKLEHGIVADRLRVGFDGQDGPNVDLFLSFSLSVQNRRKARAGQALEHHLGEIFRAHQLRFDRGARTENQSRPDFLFPGATEYHDASFPTCRLSMLGAKSTCKDRWRQVLSEAARILNKHLLTLEPGISLSQTNEMRANNLQLVLPAELHETYLPEQRASLMDLSGFIALAREREGR